MKRKYLLVVAIAIATLGILGGWIMPKSECELLVRANDDEKAFPVCMVLAQQDNAYAQNVVGVSYATGSGIPQNFDTAIFWLHQSAAQGFAKAQSNMALAYLEGEGVKRSHAEAQRWWRLAAAQGEPYAQFNLAVSYTKGYGVNQDAGIADSLYLASFLSFLKAGEFRSAFEGIKYIRIHWPWFERNTIYSQPLKA